MAEEKNEEMASVLESLLKDSEIAEQQNKEK